MSLEDDLRAAIWASRSEHDKSNRDCHGCGSFCCTCELCDCCSAINVDRAVQNVLTALRPVWTQGEIGMLQQAVSYLNGVIVTNEGITPETRAVIANMRTRLTALYSLTE